MVFLKIVKLNDVLVGCRAPELPITLSWSVDKALQRWNTAIGVFAHIFLAEGPGSERANFLNARAGFASRMARFRHQVLTDITHRHTHTHTHTLTLALHLSISAQVVICL